MHFLIYCFSSLEIRNALEGIQTEEQLQQINQQTFWNNMTAKWLIKTKSYRGLRWGDN